MMVTRINYSLETKKLRIYRSGDEHPDVHCDVLLAQIGSKAFFLQIRWDRVRESAERLFEGKLAPSLPAQVWEIADTIRQLRRITPLLALDLPGWRNPQEDPRQARQEWLAALRQLDAELARKARQFIQEGGAAEYLLRG
jgi:hypothetical protein